MRKAVLAFILTVGSLFTLPAFAWPEVDHMNMCGSATKVVRTYGGASQGWAQRDHYLERRGNAYYFRANCPDTKAPVKKAKAKTAYNAMKKSVAKKAVKTVQVKKITKRLRGGYDEHADCVQVDRMNNYGRAVNVVGRR